jgi:hypothetical protein
MSIRIDQALQSMPQRLQDEFRHEMAGRRSGPIADAVLPLNATLLARQEKIDSLTAQLSALRAERDALRADAERIAWLLARMSGRDLREAGVTFSSGGINSMRKAIDAARAALKGE